MNKILMGLMCMGLLMGSMASAVMSPKRLAHCIVNPRSCTKKEQEEKRVWVATASVAAILAVLAVIGFTAAPWVIQKMKEEDARVAKINGQLSDMAIERQELSRKRDKTEEDYQRINFLEQEMSKVGQQREK